MLRSLPFPLAAALAAATLAGPASAAPPAKSQAPLAEPANVRPAFGNTVLVIDPDGRSRKLWLAPDGTWTGLSRRGLDLAGRWSVQGGKVCLTQSKPGLPGRLCHVFPTKPGASLAAKDPGGTRVQLKLVEGRVTK